MLAKRILTAFIGIPLAIFLINYGGWPFVATVSSLAFIAWFEFSNMLKRRQIHVSNSLGIAAIALLIGCAWLGIMWEQLAVLTAGLIVILVKAVFSHASFNMADVAFTLFGINYIGLLFSHLILLRFTDISTQITTPFATLAAGAAYLWLAFIGTWASDTFAYFIGSKFGKHKLCPAISPGKTIEGAAGGLAGSILAVILFGNFFQIGLIHSLVLGFLIGVAAPVGDLAESALKRFTGVKDSGRLLPGHGGALDRFDSILFAVPTVYYYVTGFILP